MKYLTRLKINLKVYFKAKQKKKKETATFALPKANPSF